MDFFTAQTRARGKTRQLVILFSIAVLAISAGVHSVIVLISESTDVRRILSLATDTRKMHDGIAFWDLGHALISLGVVSCIIGGGSLYRWFTLRAGGEAVARMMGGTRIRPHAPGAPLEEQQLLNVVEEMAIAAGMPVPAVFVLRDEPGINAFAAGFTTSDAVVAVSQGALQRLTREEIQAVVGHEFSHILNGDMCMNLRLTAILFGILSITHIGRILVRAGAGSQSSGGRGKRGNAAGAIALGGVALIALGYLGYFLGRLIQAAVSRQREFLADASAVQFTRNPDAMASALNKIRVTALSSVLLNPASEEIGHSFYAQGFNDFPLGWFDTHPPLETRIKAIQPDFNFTTPPPAPSARYASTPRKAPQPAQRLAVAPRDATACMASIGTFAAEQVLRAQSFIGRLPIPLYTAAHDPKGARTIILGLLLDKNPDVRARQCATPGMEGLDGELLDKLSELDARQRLPLLQITLGALRTTTAEEQDKLVSLAQQLADADGRVSIFEYALLSLLKRHLAALRNPRRTAHVRHVTPAAIADPATVVLSFITRAGNPRPGDAEKIFDAGLRTTPSLRGKLRLLPTAECNFRRLDKALEELAAALPVLKQQVLLSAAQTAAADGVVAPEEAELLRVIAGALDCPMPLLA
jgi:Zn-dependent protease with chaperone function